MKENTVKNPYTVDGKMYAKNQAGAGKAGETYPQGSGHTMGSKNPGKASDSKYNTGY